MKYTYYGHSCFAVEISGKHILFDPFISPNPLASEIKIAEVKADYIFVSHAHYDHLADLVEIAKMTGARVVSCWEIMDWCVKQGINNTIPLNPGGKVEFDFGTVKAFTAVHSSSFPDGSYGGAAEGFVFVIPEGNFYYSGDTALTLDMQLVAKYARINFAILPIGDEVTMGAEDAVTAAQIAGAGLVIPVHYDTYDFIKINRDAVKSVFAINNIALRFVAIGETVDI